MVASRGSGLRTRAFDILRNAKSREEVIDKLARLLSELDDAHKENDRLTAELDKINYGKVWREVE